MGAGDRVPETGSVGTDVGAPRLPLTRRAGAGLRVVRGDRWSDTDLVLAVRGDVSATVAEWSRWLYDDCSARHQW